MKGTLTKNSEGVWMVKWSDLHSFAHGTHWMYTELVDNGYIDGLKLYDSNEGLEVEFEMVAGYDNNGPEHFPRFAKILKEDKMVTKCYCGHTSYCDCGPLLEDKINIMKNKEEIEKLAESIYGNGVKDYNKEGFIAGYTQCQEDMADESIRFAEWIRIKDFQTASINNWIGLDMKYYTTKELFEQFNSLNKQE